MLTCPSDEVCPSPRWCCAELESFPVVVSALQLKVSLRVMWTRAWRADVHVVLVSLVSDVAVGGLITVRKVQTWGRKIVSEIMAFNARSQDFGGPLRCNHPLILNS